MKKAFYYSELLIEKKPIIKSNFFYRKSSYEFIDYFGNLKIIKKFYYNQMYQTGTRGRYNTHGFYIQYKNFPSGKSYYFNEISSFDWVNPFNINELFRIMEIEDGIKIKKEYRTSNINLLIE